MEKKMNDQIISLSTNEMNALQLYQTKENLNNELMNKIGEKQQLQGEVKDTHHWLNWYPLFLTACLGVIALLAGNPTACIPLLFAGATVGATNLAFERKLDRESSPEGQTNLILNKLKNGWSKELLVFILSLVLFIPCAMINSTLSLFVLGVLEASLAKGGAVLFARKDWKETDEKLQTISEKENVLKSEIEKVNADLDQTLKQTDEEKQADVKQQTESTPVIISYDPVQAYQDTHEAQPEQIAQTTENLGRQKKIHR